VIGAEIETQSLAVTAAEGARRASAADSPLLPRDLIGRYRLRRLLGQGGMSSVYLARDTMLGRSVALKLVRPERVSATEAEHFIREAQITAQLNHPHIVQVYDAGLQAGRAYLALEYLDGESLKARAERGRLSLDEVLRIAQAIAEALDHAHASRIHHCDLKPSNVMLPDDGRVRVVDFGLASMGGAGGRLGGTPDWMAPEQWRKEPTTDRVDVWALAVMLHQLVFDRHPFGATLEAIQRRDIVLDPNASPQIEHGNIPGAIRDLLVRSLQRAPSARPSVAEWRSKLTDLVAPSAGALTTLESPFRGLAAFEEQHASFFFGRDQEVDAYLERLRDQPLLPIVGPSGAGKSSFLHAGVIPRLRARGRWCVIKLRPGSEPFTTLAHQLLDAERAAAPSIPPRHREQPEATALANELRTTPSLLANRLAAIAAAQHANVLLACDQLEELFTHSKSEADTRCFVDMLTTVADDAHEPIRVAYTLRDDFLGHMPEIRQLFVLRRMDSVGLRRTVTAPIERLGFRFENVGIVDEMLREISGSQFDLSLLQFACRRLWDSRDLQRNLLLESTYREHGGVARALATHADGVLAEMPIDQQRLARQIFGRLVIGTTTRRTVELDTLVDDLPPYATAVIDRLVSARLLVKRRIPGEASSCVEIAHESLLATWRQLKDWLEESGEERRFTLELEEAAEFWLKRGERPEQTLASDELVAARQRIAKLGVSVSSRIERFLAAGERRKRTLKRRKQLQRVTTIGIAGIVTMVSLLLARSFRDQKNAAESQAQALAKQAESLQLAAGNQGQVDLIIKAFDRPGDFAPAAELPELSISLFAAQPHDVNRPGQPLPANLASVTRSRADTFSIEAPGGMIFLRIDGRGRPRERCAASWLRIEALPGYADRDKVRPIELQIPTCRASAADTITIPAGEFIYGGSGEPSTRFNEYYQGVDEKTVWLDRFGIDRTEASNAWFAPFATLSNTTGYAIPQYPDDGVSGLPASPVAAIDAYEAEAYCRFMGKRLPSDHEWTKAARGGLRLDGAANPNPRRLYPWGAQFLQGCVNMAGDTDGFEWVAPVDALSCGASPYKVLNMAGNVGEWIASEGQTGPPTPLRIARGGAINSPLALEQTTTVFRNTREGRHFDFATGVRCVTDGDSERGSQWWR